MALIENALTGKIDKIKIAIDRLKAHEPDKGYFLAFSGGKDSVVIEHLARQSRVKYDAHYHLTTVDPPELVKFIKKQYPSVVIDKPEKTMLELIVENRFVPMRQQRWCCRFLKEGYGEGRVVVTGIRWAESPRRKNKRRLVENCQYGKDRLLINPIIDWSDNEVWEYIRKYNLKYCHLYDEGFSRLGCVLCPMKTAKQKRLEIKRWPRIAEAYKRAIARAMQERERDNKKCDFKNEEDLFNWWVSGNSNDNKSQLTLFD